MDESQESYPPNVVDSTSSRLLQLARENDASAWRQLLHVYGPVVRYWIRRDGLTSASVSDVFQDVFAAVSTNLRGFEPKEGRGSFRKWLKTITNNKITDHYRKLGRQPNAVGGSAAHERIASVPVNPLDPSTIVTVSDETLVIRQVMKLIRTEFSKENLLMFKRTVIDGRSSSEVAEELAAKPAAVRKAKSRILKRLRQAMEDYDA